MKRYLLVFFILTVLVGISDAQDDASDVWEVVQQCLPTPAQSEDGWAFEGELLMSGWGGIHALNADSDRPTIISWQGGNVSPDGRWVLSQPAESSVEQLSGPGPMGRYHYDYGNISAHNLITGEIRVFPWQGYFGMNSNPYLWTPPTAFWLDERRFAAFYDRTYDARIVDIVTGEISDWEHVDLGIPEFSFSPDLTRVIHNSRLYALPDYVELKEENIGAPYDRQTSVWSNDSSTIADTTLVRDEDYNTTTTLTLYDRDGTVVATPFVREYITIHQWSPDGAYLLFSAAGERPTLHLLDLHNQQVLDLCIVTNNQWVWSPDGQQFASVIGRWRQDPVVIVDMETWQSRIVAYHTGYIQRWIP